MLNLDFQNLFQISRHVITATISKRGLQLGPISSPDVKHAFTIVLECH